MAAMNSPLEPDDLTERVHDDAALDPAAARSTSGPHLGKDTS